LRAEGAGWPPKKTGKTINAKQNSKIVAGNFRNYSAEQFAVDVSVTPVAMAA